jgi:hypothetical protein
VSRAVAPRLAAGLLLLTIAALAAGGGFGIAAHDLMNAFAFGPVLLAFAGRIPAAAAVSASPG